MGTQVKRIKLEPLLDIRGSKFEIPKRDTKGTVMFKHGKDGQECPTCKRPIQVDIVETSDLRDVLEEIILYRIPRDTYTAAVAAKVAESYREIRESRKAKGNAVLEMGNDTYGFVKGLLEDDKIVQMYLANIVPIQEALEQFQYAREDSKKEE